MRLNTNESPESPPEELLVEIAGLLGSVALNRYPDRRATALREAIASHHGVEAGQVFCANGSNEVLQCLLLAYGGPSRRALVFEPTYALHSHIAHLCGTEVSTARRGDSFRVERAEGLAAVAEVAPHVVLLCSPNNPTGNCEDRSTVEALTSASEGLVVVDEAYAQFSPWSAVDLLSQHPNLAVVRTFSKTWALAALRLGYLVADEEVVEACFSTALPYHLDSVKQAAGVAALAHEPEMRERVALIVKERGRIEEGLSGLGVEVWPSDANFVLFRPPGGPGAIWAGLVERSVLVRDVSGFERLEGCLRVTVGTPEENGRFLQALGEVLASGH